VIGDSLYLNTKTTYQFFYHLEIIFANCLAVGRHGVGSSSRAPFALPSNTKGTNFTSIVFLNKDILTLWMIQIISCMPD